MNSKLPQWACLGGIAISFVPILLNSCRFQCAASMSLRTLPDVPIALRQTNGGGWTPSHNCRHNRKWHASFKHASATSVPQGKRNDLVHAEGKGLPKSRR